jgi:hypothetical protein
MQLARRTFCKTINELRPCANLPPKVPRTNVLEWRTPEDRDEKTGSSCIKIPQLDRSDDDLKMTQMKGASAKCQDEPRGEEWARTSPEKAQAGRPVRTSPAHFCGSSGPPLLGVK